MGWLPIVRNDPLTEHPLFVTSKRVNDTFFRVYWRRLLAFWQTKYMLMTGISRIWTNSAGFLPRHRPSWYRSIWSIFFISYYGLFPSVFSFKVTRLMIYRVSLHPSKTVRWAMLPRRYISRRYKDTGPVLPKTAWQNRFDWYYQNQ